MTTVPDLLDRISAHCREAKMAETTFGRLVVNDGKFVKRLRAGGSITIDTLHRVERALDEADMPSTDPASADHVTAQP